MDGVQLPQRYRASTVRNSWYLFDRLRKDERLSRPWSPSGSEFKTPGLGIQCAVTTKPLLHESKLTYFFIFTLLCGASKGFMKDFKTF